MRLFNKTSYGSFNAGYKAKWLAISLTILAGFVVFYTISVLFDPVSVVVAKTNIEEASVVKPESIEIIKVAKRDCQEGTYQHLEDVAGRVAAINIFPGQQIIEQQLSNKGDEVGLAPANIKPHQTLICLTTQQAVWSSQLQVGDLVTVVAVYPTEMDVREEAVGRITKPTTRSIIKNLKSVQEAQSTSPTQTEISFVTDIEGGKRVLLALKNSQMVYLMPRHPDLGGVD